MLSDSLLASHNLNVPNNIGVACNKPLQDDETHSAIEARGPALHWKFEVLEEPPFLKHLENLLKAYGARFGLVYCDADCACRYDYQDGLPFFDQMDSRMPFKTL
jgi:hypothetical protein